MYIKRIVFVLVSFFLLIAADELSAQGGRGNYNFMDFNQKPYYFGITLAYNTSNFYTRQSRNLIGSDSIRLVESITGPGFNLGIVTNLKVGEYFDIRFLPTLSFSERNINYAAVRDVRPPFSRKIESVFVETPIQVRYKSEPFNDMRLFVLAGVKYSFDVASESRTRQSTELVKVSPTDFALEIGAGAQFFFPYFIFSPELKFSHGLSNVLIFDRSLQEASVIEKILSRSFTISLHFEG
jgi:hypothetical protein